MKMPAFRSMCVCLVVSGLAAGCAASGQTDAVDAGADGGRPARDAGGSTDSGGADGHDDGGGEGDADAESSDADPIDADPADGVTPDVAPDTAAPDAEDTTASDGGTDGTGSPDTLDDGCSEKLRFIYVIDKNKRLHSFDPDSGTFTAVGDVDCGEFSDTTPSSMAMSRLGVALVNYSDNSLQTVDIDDAGCTPSGWREGTGGFNRFGMGYVADTRGGAETLYISSADTLATIDTDTWRVTEIGPLPSQSELSGTGNGELWGFFPLESPPQLLQLDRSDASVLQSFDLPPLPPNLDTFAFTAWNGEFYLFYRLSGLGETTTVYRFDRATETLERVVDDSGLNIVGAGVSICAPTGD